jgi:hypothetical protein
MRLENLGTPPGPWSRGDEAHALLTDYRQLCEDLSTDGSADEIAFTFDRERPVPTPKPRTEDDADSNPDNHRAAAGGTWSSDSYDPFADILAMADLLESKGYTVGRIITSRTVLSILAGNDKVKARTGVATINASGQITATAGRATRDAINGALERDGLPAIETYDLQYRTQTGTGYFLSRSAFVLVATTGQDESIDLGDTNSLMVANTLGYTALGRAAGQAMPGRVLRMEAFENKPPRIEAEGWQTSLPVITNPEAIAVITSIS